jgi:hypothetical protein
VDALFASFTHNLVDFYTNGQLKPPPSSAHRHRTLQRANMRSTCRGFVAFDLFFDFSQLRQWSLHFTCMHIILEVALDVLDIHHGVVEVFCTRFSIATLLFPMNSQCQCG